MTIKSEVSEILSPSEYSEKHAEECEMWVGYLSIDSHTDAVKVYGATLNELITRVAMIRDGINYGKYGGDKNYD